MPSDSTTHIARHAQRWPRALCESPSPCAHAPRQSSHTHTHIYTHTRTHIYIHTHVRMHSRAHALTHVRTHTHTHTHTDAHTETDTLSIYTYNTICIDGEKAKYLPSKKNIFPGSTPDVPSKYVCENTSVKSLVSLTPHPQPHR